MINMTTLLSPWTRVPKMEAAFSPCTAIETLYSRNWWDCCSCVSSAICLPRSLKEMLASSPTTPRVSTAIGTKWWVASRWAASRWAYLLFLCCLALAATAPASVDASCLCEGAKVSAQVTSHTSTLPLFHGTIVASDGWGSWQSQRALD